jgi:hypothetical protein
MAAYDFPASPTVGQAYQGYVWDGTKWIASAAGASPVYVSDTPPANPVDGAVWFESDTLLTFIRYNDGNSSQWVQFGTGVADPVMPGHLFGLTLSSSGANFTVAAGMAANNTGLANMRLNAPITKTMAAWAVGSGNGGLDTGAMTSGWKHVFLIKRPDTGVVDVLFSASATAPTLPANYTLFRRIGSMATNTTTWTPFSQLGDEFLWATASLDVQKVTSAPTNYTLLVPIGYQCRALFSAYSGPAGVDAYYSFYSPDAVVNPVNTPDGRLDLYVPVASHPNSGGQFDVRTNTSGQIGIIASGSIPIRLATFGWIDRRGRDA